MTGLILGARKGKGYPGAIRGESGDFFGPMVRTPPCHYQEPGFKVAEPKMLETMRHGQKLTKQQNIYIYINVFL